MRRLLSWIVCTLCFLTAKQALPGEVRGMVTDRAVDSPLPGVNLSLVGTRLGAVSDSVGAYVIREVPAGTYRLKASAIGYRTATLEDLAVRPDSVLRRDVGLRLEAIALDEVVVTPGRFSVIQSTPGTVQTLSREEVRVMPQFGEDIYRAIVRLPGVSGSDYSARFNIRGEDYDRILVNLDGLELYEPFHLKDIAGGTLSIVDVDVIGGIDMMTGGFPAEYGDRQSAVMEMTSRKPREGRRTLMGIGLMNARVLSEGSSSDFGWLVSARRGYMDLLLKLVGEGENLSPNYYDLYGKFTFGGSGRNRFGLHVLRASDGLSLTGDNKLDHIDTGYGNSYVWLTWDANRGSALHVRSMPYVGRITQKRHGKTYDEGKQVDEIVDDERGTAVYGLKSDAKIQLGDSHLLKFGSDVKRLRADYDYFKRDRIDTRVSQTTMRIRHDTTRVALWPAGWEVGLYAGDKWRLFGPLTADVGLRYDRQSTTGEGQISPRGGLALALGARTVVRAAWGRYYQAQGLGELDVQDGITAFRRASKSTHYLAGIEWMGPGLHVRVEGYRKDLRRIRDRFVNMRDEVEAVPEIEDDRIHVFPASGTARGIECYLKRDRGGHLSWWVAYAFAQSYETLAQLLSPSDLLGRRIPRKFDQRHTFSVDLIYRPSPAWYLSMAWQIRSGWPFTPRRLVLETAPDGFQFYKEQFEGLYTDRYPDFHRLDVKISRLFTIGACRLSTALEVINLYNRRNVRNYDYQYQVNRGDIITNRKANKWLPILPSFTVSAEF